MKSTVCFKKYSDASTHKIEAEEPDYLYVKGSLILGSGDGLFTAISIYRDEVISIFKGKILSDLQAEHRANKGKDVLYQPTRWNYHGLYVCEVFCQVCQ